MVKVLVGLLIILILVGFFIARANELDLGEGEDRVKFAFEYSKWIYKSVINVKGIVGFIVKQDWSIKEDKNETES